MLFRAWLRLWVLARLPSATGPPGFYTAVIIIVSVPLQQAFELRRVYIQFVSRNYNLSGIGARRCGRNREQPLSAYIPHGSDTILARSRLSAFRRFFLLSSLSSLLFLPLLILTETSSDKRTKLYRITHVRAHTTIRISA